MSHYGAYHHAVYHHVVYAAPAYHRGGGFDFGRALLSGAIHFFEFRILGAIVRMMGPWGFAFCVVALIALWFFTRRRAY